MSGQESSLELIAENAGIIGPPPSEALNDRGRRAHVKGLAKGYHVMLSCAGRRNYLVDYFQDALGIGGKVLVVDASGDAPAMIAAGTRGFILPTVADPRYFDELLSRCQESGVKLLFSLNDLELPGLARQAARFRRAGVIPVVSTPDIVDLCFDKWQTFTRLGALGIPMPETRVGLSPARAALRRGDLAFPLVVKPRWGTGSIGVSIVRNERELDLAFAWLECTLERTALGSIGGEPAGESIVVQQALEGQEFGVDIINDLDGEHRAVITKRKLSMRAGETDRAVTEPNEDVAALARTVGVALRTRGLTDCDIFLTRDGPRLLDLNPRFGGGYPFSHAAGANVPAALLAWSRGEEARPEWLTARPGVVSAKCDMLVCRLA